MIVVSNRIPVNPQHAEAFEQRFADRASLVDGMPGPTEPGDPYIVMTFWDSQAHFKAWTESDSFTKGHAQSGSLPRDAFLGHPSLEVHEVIQSTIKIERLAES